MSRSELLLVAFALVAGVYTGYRFVSERWGSVPVANGVLEVTIPEKQLASLAIPLAQGGGESRVYEVMDYQCPPCRSQESGNAAFRARNPKVRWSVLPYPIASHPQSWDLSLLAYSANQKGRGAVYHIKAMQDEISGPQALKLLAKSELETESLQSLRQDRDLRRTLDTVKKLPIQGTPTYFVFRGDGRSMTTHDPSQIAPFLGL